MKKNLTHLTGIVFIIAILVAGSCKPSTQPNDTEKEENVSAMGVKDSTKVDIFLKAILLDGKVHLLMYDTKKPDCEVIDNLVTVVYPGYTVKWKKADDSEIDEVLDIRLVEADSIFSISQDNIGVKDLFKLEIPGDAEPGTIKYEIVFTVKKDTTTWTIDPYLRIPNN